MKVVINTCFGGFGLSHKAIMLYARKSGFKLYPFTDKRDENGHLVSFRQKNRFREINPDKEECFMVYYCKSPLKDGNYQESSWFSDRDLKRTDKVLVEVVEELGEEANGDHAKLSVVEIPDGIEYEIDEYDGSEHIAEKHRTWR